MFTFLYLSIKQKKNNLKFWSSILKQKVHILTPQLSRYHFRVFFHKSECVTQPNHVALIETDNNWKEKCLMNMIGGVTFSVSLCNDRFSFNGRLQHITVIDSDFPKLFCSV